MNPVIVTATHRPLRLILLTRAPACEAHVRDVLAGEEVSCVARIDAALEQLAHTDVDCVLIDLELPEAPGTAGVKRLADIQVPIVRSEEHTSELQSLRHLVCRLL